MGRRPITKSEKNQWFQEWLNSKSFGQVAEKFRVARKSVSKAHKEDEWEKREERIKEEAIIIADAKSSKRLARNLEIIQFLKEQIIKMVKKNKLRGYVSDVPNLIKIEELLVGNPDSRPEVIHRDPTQIRESVERFAESLGLRISFNGIGPSRISPALLSATTPPEHKE